MSADVLLVMVVVTVVAFAAVVALVTWRGRKAARSRARAPVAGGADAGGFFFVPSTPEAWAEVCRNAETAGPTTPGPWSHPLIGEALEDAEPTIRDGKSLLTYVEFTRVYEPRSRDRVEHCAAAYRERIASR